MANNPLPYYAPSFLVTRTKTDYSVSRVASKAVSYNTTARLLLYNSSTGEVRIWNLTKSDAYSSYVTPITESGLTAESYYRRSDGYGYILLRKPADDSWSIFHVDADCSYIDQAVRDPAPTWIVTSMIGNPTDTNFKLLFANPTNGYIAVVVLDSSLEYVDYPLYLEGYTGFKATSYDRSIPGRAKILLINGSTYVAKMLTLDGNDNLLSTKTYGAYSGWLANSYKMCADGTRKMLWTNPSTGNAELWTLDVNDDYVSKIEYTLGANWVATSYEEVLP